jgi:lysophospholipase L1-like esterase
MIHWKDCWSLPGHSTSLSNPWSIVHERLVDSACSVLQGWTAFGDSYAAGLGANGFWGCGQGRNAYPNYLNNPAFGFAPLDDHQFSFLACSGAVTNDIVTTQLPAFRSSVRAVKDSATISVGGNDVNFSGILKACVYRTLWAGDCAQIMTAAQTRIDGIATEIAAVYTQILDAAVEGGAPYHFTLFATGEFLTCR